MLHPKQHISPEQYLELEKNSRDKHEYWNGEIYMMAGTSLRHNRIVINTTQSLDRALAKRPCSVFASDIRLRIQKDDSYTYPDVMVICGEVQVDPRQQDTVMNPTLIVEVLSDSTAAYDRSEKFKMYRGIPSLEHYVMIEQSQPYIESYRREGRFWVLETLEGVEAIMKLRVLDLEIPLSEIYDRIDWTND